MFSENQDDAESNLNIWLFLDHYIVRTIVMRALLPKILNEIHWKMIVCTYGEVDKNCCLN